MNNLHRRYLLSRSMTILSTFNKVLCSQLAIVKSKDANASPTLTINNDKTPSVLEPCDEEDIAHVAPYLKPAFNFAAYVNKSETLQELLKLGVNLHKLEKQKNVPEFILGLNFETDIKEHVMFLHDFGVPLENVGELITRNPFIFKESLENLKVRINYLESKKFTSEMIIKIIIANSSWLSFNTREIDKKLGYFQITFSLSGDEVRSLTVKQPKLITYNQWHIKKSLFGIKEEMGFNDEEIKHLLLQQPRIFMNDPKKVLQTFHYLHNQMKIPQNMIVQMPEVLTCRFFRLQQRHQYLQKLNKVQFNPKEPGYISPLAIVTGSDGEFCSNVAKTSIESYNTFLKTL